MLQTHRICSLLLLIFCLAGSLSAAETRPTRLILLDLVLASEDATGPLLEELGETGDPFIGEFVDAWRTGEVYSLPDETAPKRVFQRANERFYLLADGTEVQLPKEEEALLEKVRPSRSLRRELKRITDTIDLSSPIDSVRMEAARKLGLSQNAEYLPALQRKFEAEPEGRVKRVFEEAYLINFLGQNPDEDAVVATITRLGELKSLTGRGFIEEAQKSALETGNERIATVCHAALKRIENHLALVEQLGNLFRGLSLGSVLLMVSFGLAITFGLMGIINMAHGEFIAIGGYTCFMVQNFFAAQFGVQSAAYQWFFIASLPVSFLVAAAIGAACERTFIRFLYRRPLESLLATWGLSMVLQQTYRLIFGAANVQVNTPDFLLGNLEIAGASLSYTRLFVIAFAGLIVIATWLLLSKTNLGLYIRAVMQNRQMAASLGIPVDRVNTLTFAFGCGLASLAGAALSQIGNVGPSMGQTYIVDSFMVVVAGSVGNLLGAGVSAMGIGLVDQFLQPSLGPVMGKITVFAAIILFLQWKPGGLFPTKSRSLDD